MINFIHDYSKIGIGFSFRECPDCGNIRVVLTKECVESHGLLVARTCVNEKLFKNEDLLIAELANCIKELHNENF